MSRYRVWVSNYLKKEINYKWITSVQKSIFDKNRMFNCIIYFNWLFIWEMYDDMRLKFTSLIKCQEKYISCRDEFKCILLFFNHREYLDCIEK